MSLIRGIRSMVREYSREDKDQTEPNENIVSSIVLETSDDDDFYVKIANAWPESIILSARIIPERNFASDLFAEITNGSASLGKNYIYSAPLFHSASEIKNKDNFCSKACIKYENVGEFLMDNKLNSFFGNSFDDYEIKFAVDNVIFEREFMKLSASVFEKLAGTSISSASTTTHHLYPYGGFFRHGAHSEEIESCFFQVIVEKAKTAIRILRSKKILASLSEGVKLDFPQGAPQPKSLYDDLLNGESKIVLINKITSKSCTYKSNSVYHISATNLIKINFIKEEE